MEEAVDHTVEDGTTAGVVRVALFRAADARSAASLFVALCAVLQSAGVRFQCATRIGRAISASSASTTGPTRGKSAFTIYAH